MLHNPTQLDNPYTPWQVWGCRYHGVQSKLPRTTNRCLWLAWRSSVSLTSHAWSFHHPSFPLTAHWFRNSKFFRGATEVSIHLRLRSFATLNHTPAYREPNTCLYISLKRCCSYVSTRTSYEQHQSCYKHSPFFLELRRTSCWKYEEIYLV
jgi:hypothetical protein